MRVLEPHTLVVVVVVVLAVCLMAAQMANPCFIMGHVPMGSGEYGCPLESTWAAPIILCGSEFQVCRRCKLMYLESVKGGTEKKR